MEIAFEKTKDDISRAVMLSHPDPSARLSVHSDASDTAIGGAVHQSHGNTWKPLGFFSRKLSPTEARYSAYDRELLALYCTIKHFVHILEGRNFTCYVDHKPLTFAFDKKSEVASPRQARQLSYISQFTTDIRHIQGSKNIVADTLSRIEVASTSYPSPADLADAQQSDVELAKLLQSASTGLQLQKLKLNDNDPNEVYCDVSTHPPRPFIPVKYRKAICERYHNLSHPGKKATLDLIKKRVVWPHMNKFVTEFVRNCLDCQKSKVQRHEKSPLQEFSAPQERFSCVHLDIVGPLPPSRNKVYLITCIDRFSRWVEAIPIEDQTAETIARAFMDHWVSRFGLPKKIVTDQGRNFTSNLFQSLATQLGIDACKITAYHPQANGIVERWHRSLKAALMCRLKTKREKWADHLAPVLLGLRTAIKEDLGYSPAELLYGSTLRLPGDLFNTSAQPTESPYEYVESLKNAFRDIAPSIKTRWHSQAKIFKHPELENCTHVFLRDDSSRKSLVPPYTGPFQVIERDSKTFTLDINGKQVKVSKDRLKPAFSENFGAKEKHVTFATYAQVVTRGRVCGDHCTPATTATAAPCFWS